jgi:hypothetical protein
VDFSCCCGLFVYLSTYTAQAAMTNMMAAGGGVAWLFVAAQQADYVTSSFYTAHAIGELWPRTVCRAQQRLSRHVVLHVVRAMLSFC